VGSKSLFKNDIIQQMMSKNLLSAQAYRYYIFKRFVWIPNRLNLYLPIKLIKQ